MTYHEFCEAVVKELESRGHTDVRVHDGPLDVVIIRIHSVHNGVTHDWTYTVPDINLTYERVYSLVMAEVRKRFDK